MINKTIYNYTIKSKLGEGGMAEVWYAENSIGKKATVKILKKEFIYNDAIIERFENEARVMVALEHSNIRKVYDLGKIDGKPAIIMEYLEGEDLSQKLKKGINYTNAELIKWWNQSVEALQYVHKKGVIHRDIKPSNLFVTTEGDVKLMDFGIAKSNTNAALTSTGQVMGTPLYMSPEQVKDSKNISAKTDMYSLAVTFVQLLTRRLPYGLSTDSSQFDIQMRIVDTMIDTSTLPMEWRELSKYLQKDAGDRAELSPIKERGTNYSQPQFDSEVTQILNETPDKTQVVDIPKIERLKAKETNTEEPEKYKMNDLVVILLGVWTVFWMIIFIGVTVQNNSSLEGMGIIILYLISYTYLLKLEKSAFWGSSVFFGLGFLYFILTNEEIKLKYIFIKALIGSMFFSLFHALIIFLILQIKSNGVSAWEKMR